jgi:outer membrane receptor protein involved in Fe transport
LQPGRICTGGTPYTLASYENQDSSQPKFDARFDQELSAESRLTYAGGVAGTDGIIHTGIGPFDIQPGTVLGYGKVNYNRENLRINFFANILDGDAINQFGSTGTDGKPLNLIFKNQTYDIEFGDSRLLGERNILSYGGNYRRNNFDISIAPDAEDRNEVGGYIQDEFFTDKIRIVAGARVDKFSVIDDPVFSPRVTFMFKPAPEHSLRASYNKAFRSPSAINNFLETTILNLVVLPTGPFIFPTSAVGNPNLKQESLSAYEVGYTGELSGKTTFGISYYINDSKDNINFTPFLFYSPLLPPPGWPLPPAFVPPNRLPALFTYLNFGPLRQQGVELSLDQIVTSSIGFSVNYSYQKDPEILDAESDEIQYPLIEVIFPPKHRFNAGVNFNSRRYLGSFSVNYQSDAFWTDVLDARFFGPTDDFTQLNAAFGVKWMEGRIVTTLKITNLTNEDIQQHVFGDILKRTIIGEVKFNF